MPWPAFWLIFQLNFSVDAGEMSVPESRQEQSSFESRAIIH